MHHKREIGVFGVGGEEGAGNVLGVVVEAGLLVGRAGEGGFGGHHLGGGLVCETG